MRLLFLTNLYPPLSNGGYELWCQEVAEGLRQRGHVVIVLTTRRQNAQPEHSGPEWVRRQLYMEMEFASSDHAVKFFTVRKERERANVNLLRKTITEISPDAVMVWGMWNLSRTLPATVEALLPGRVFYYFGDYWPTLPSQHRFYWEAKSQSRAAHLLKSILRPLALWMLDREPMPELKFQHVLFPSAFMQADYARRGFQFQNKKVILGAVDTCPFQAPGGDANISITNSGRAFQLLYVGRLSPEKGMPVLIQALDELVSKQGLSVNLSIVGSGERGYVTSLHQQVQMAGLDSVIHFLPTVPKEDMAALYRRFDAVIFPSSWEEPFGRVLVEAMASGVAVIATATGGAAEIIRPEENALTFPPDDYQELAAQICRLMKDPELCLQLSITGHRDAIVKFDSARMVTEIESYLLTSVCL